MEDVHEGQFLGLPPVGTERAEAAVLPVPMEQTVSYGDGTAGGPQAILEASCQVELFDEETLVDFAESPRVLTLDPVRADGGVQDWLDAITDRVAEVREGRFVLALGGEHTLTCGVVRGIVDEPSELTVVQIDAHADLADELDDRRWSHGTVMRRLHEMGCTILQVGIRSLSREEYRYALTEDNVSTFFAHELGRRSNELIGALEALRGPVYLTIDVDGLDPSVIPSTGTPQPNGLSWRDTMAVLAALGRSGCELVGADIVEFVPSPHPPGCDIVPARLAQKVLGYWWRSVAGGAGRKPLT